MRRLPRTIPSALLALCLGAGTAHSALLLSELCDPTNNYTTDRFIEVWNSGPDAVDLTNWSVVAIANGVDVTTWPLAGSLPAGQARVVGNSTTVTSFVVNFPNSQWGASGYFNWNGKVGDGAKLVNPSGTITDQVLATGTLFENSDMERNANVTAPNPVFTSSEWTIRPVLLATDGSPGTHNGSLPPAAGPVISGIVTDPVVPVADSAVAVQASVEDTSAAITAVTLQWGTAAGSFTNSIGMPLLSGSVYRTATPIPGHSAGTTVYYRVQADDGTTSSVSPASSYLIGGGVAGAPTVLAVGEMSDSTLLVTFSEAVEQTSAETPGNYTIATLTAVGAASDPLHPAQVLVTFRNLVAGAQTLTVNGVADLTATVAYGATCNFNYVNVSVPAGYYDGAIGLKGSALRIALHNLIRNHASMSYTYALTAFGTTDVRPDGKIWDMYSDIPGGTPPYEYSVGQTGQGGTEGLGYNREHSFPQSWFGGASPMYSDLWILLPTDSYVNGKRSNYAYGVVGTASWTSLNGSKLGASASGGYSGTVFEPVDAYKGDLARSTFYVATRYFGEDAGWPGGPESSGAELYPWAANQYLQWSGNDPVSWKERLRNGAIYAIQHNRNPFVDHPEFVAAIYDSNSVAGVGERPVTGGVRLGPNSPNPFATGTAIPFELPARARVTAAIYDVSGRRVRTLAGGSEFAAGLHELRWNGRDDAGTRVRAGLYFCRLDADGATDARRIALTN